MTSSNLSWTWKIPSSSSVSKPLCSFPLATEAFGKGCTITDTSATVSNKQESSSLLENKIVQKLFLDLKQNCLKVENHENGGVAGRWQMLGICLGPWRQRFICRLNLHKIVISICFCLVLTKYKAIFLQWIYEIKFIFLLCQSVIRWVIQGKAPPEEELWPPSKHTIWTPLLPNCSMHLPCPHMYKAHNKLQAYPNI